jgi:hypothetical protein
MLILRHTVVHAALEFWDQAIKVQRRPFQNMVVCVSLAEEFLCGKKLFPMLQGLRAETSSVIHPWNFWFPFIRERLLLGHEGIEGLAILVPDFHHSGALGIQVFFVIHRASLCWIVAGSLAHHRLVREIRSKRRLRTILRVLLITGADLFEKQERSRMGFSFVQERTLIRTAVVRIESKILDIFGGTDE